MKSKVNIILIILLVLLMLSFGGLYALIASKNNTLAFEQGGLYKVEYIYEEVQKLYNLEKENIGEDNSLSSNSLTSIDRLVADFMTNDSIKKYFSQDPDMIAVANGISNNWETFKKAIVEFRSTNDLETFQKASEVSFGNIEDTISKIQRYVYSVESKIASYKIYPLIVLGLAVLVILKMLFDALKLLKLRPKKEKKPKAKKGKETEDEDETEDETETENENNSNEEIADNSSSNEDTGIDELSEVYNARKCQELLDTPVDLYNLREVAVLVFGLNNIEQINQEFDKQVGDEVIYTFAQLLKHATQILETEPFIGRYDDDEFIIYLSKTKEDIVKNYVDAVNEIISSYNDNEGKPYKISFGVGYSITTEDAESVTMQELFTVANEDMANNKVLVKEQNS